MPARDTDDPAHRVQLDVYRAVDPARRVRLAVEMSERARELAIQGTLARHPELTRAEARARVLRHVLGDALFDAAWPGAPPE